MHTTIITTKKPYQTACGGTRRLNSIIDACKNNNETLSIFSLKLGLRKTINIERKNEDLLITIGIPLTDVVTNIAKTFLIGKSMQGRLYYSKWAEKIIIEHKNKNCKKTIFHHIRTYRYFRTSTDEKKYLDMVDLMSLAMNARKKSYNKTGPMASKISTFVNNAISSYEEKRLKKEELNIAKYFDRIIFASERDLTSYGAKINNPHVQKLHLGPIVTNPTFREKNTVNLCGDNKLIVSTGKKSIAFHGDFNYPPNYEAALCLVNVIFPNILMEHNNCILNLIGNGSKEFSQEVPPNKLHNVIAHGFVQDLQQVLETNDLLLVPIFSGAGVQNKIIDGIQLGIPVVASEYTVNALPKNIQKLVISGLNAEQLTEKALVTLATDTTDNYHQDKSLISKAEHQMMEQFRSSVQ